jgi:hypothetical protein
MSQTNQDTVASLSYELHNLATKIHYAGDEAHADELQAIILRLWEVNKKLNLPTTTSTVIEQGIYTPKVTLKIVTVDEIVKILEGYKHNQAVGFYPYFCQKLFLAQPEIDGKLNQNDFSIIWNEACRLESIYDVKTRFAELLITKIKSILTPPAYQVITKNGKEIPKCEHLPFDPDGRIQKCDWCGQNFNQGKL